MKLLWKYINAYEFISNKYTTSLKECLFVKSVLFGAITPNPENITHQEQMQSRVCNVIYVLVCTINTSIIAI